MVGWTGDPAGAARTAAKPISQKSIISLADDFVCYKIR
jgi:hypothetical protein